MLPKKVEEALNHQIREEFYSSYLYLAMAAYFEDKSLNGFATWMKEQAREEVGHAMRIFNYVTDRRGRVILEAIPQPTTNFSSVQEVFEKALEHEQYITGKINELYALSVEEKDYPTQVMLQWFITEQVEEESTVEAILERVRLIGDHQPALILLDRELAARQSG
ncbi:MAG: ferritin [Calditrichaeota bacterium]|nr:MAG: ferritin [Calditrichota bacterium]